MSLAFQFPSLDPSSDLHVGFDVAEYVTRPENRTMLTTVMLSYCELRNIGIGVVVFIGHHLHDTNTEHEN